MADKSFSLTKLAALLIILVLIVFILIELKFIIAPLLFAVFISLLLLPLQSFIQKLVNKRMIAAIITLFVVLTVIFGFITLFSFQVVEVFQDIPTISVQLKSGVEKVLDWTNEKFGFSKSEGLNWLKTNFSKILDAPIRFFGKGITSSTQFLLDAFITLLAVFFALSYRDAIKKVILLQFDSGNREKADGLLKKIRRAVSKYLTGLLLVILILAVLNSVGLWLIGVGYPIFFGSVAAILVIIPYFGTTIGGLIPFLYSVATFDHWWQPVAVIAMYGGIQQLEGNFITPNVIGSSVKINFFVAFLALIVGGTMWGLAGIILSLPVVAILRIFCSYIDFLKPVSILMSSNIYEQTEELEELDKEKYRVGTLLKD